MRLDKSYLSKDLRNTWADMYISTLKLDNTI